MKPMAVETPYGRENPYGREKCGETAVTPVLPSFCIRATSWRFFERKSYTVFLGRDG